MWHAQNCAHIELTSDLIHSNYCSKKKTDSHEGAMCHSWPASVYYLGSCVVSKHTQREFHMDIIYTHNRSRLGNAATVSLYTASIWFSPRNLRTPHSSTFISQNLKWNHSVYICISITHRSASRSSWENTFPAPMVKLLCDKSLHGQS